MKVHLIMSKSDDDDNDDDWIFSSTFSLILSYIFNFVIWSVHFSPLIIVLERFSHMSYSFLHVASKVFIMSSIITCWFFASYYNSKNAMPFFYELRTERERECKSIYIRFAFSFSLSLALLLIFLYIHKNGSHIL